MPLFGAALVAPLVAGCDKRKYTWVVPLNPARVVAGPKGQRPKVRSLVKGLKAGQLVEIRLHAGKGPHVEHRRVSPYRVGSKVKPRTYYVHQRSQAVHSVGEVQLVFSTRTKPSKNQPIDVQKILDELIQVTYLYLEWYRARQLQRRDLSEEKKNWRRWQRTHGLCMAVRQAAEDADLEEIAQRLENANRPPASPATP